METRPPRLIEQAVGFFIPPVCREHILGDLYERYSSPVQYVLEALSTLPFVIASQVRRTFRLDLFVAEAAALYIAFGGASVAAGPAYLYDRGALIPLAILVGVALMVLVLADAYNPRPGSSSARRLEIGIALAGAFASQTIIRLIHPQWTLPVWVLLAGGAVSIPMLRMTRVSFRGDRRDKPIIADGVAPPDEVPRRSAKGYRKAWRVSLIWLAGALVVMLNSPQFRLQSGLWQFGAAVLLIAIFLTTAVLKSKKGDER